MAKGRKQGDVTDIIANVLFYIIGLGALLGGGFILWWGEDQASRYTALSDVAEKSLVELDTSKVDPALEGRLAHVTGAAESANTLSDSRFGINTKGFKLSRKVEYYQLVEHRERIEDKDRSKKSPPEYRYRYKKKWVEKPVPFTGFKEPFYRNKARAPIAKISGGVAVSRSVTLGAYKLPRFLVKEVRGQVPVKISLSEEQRSALIESMELKDPSLLREWEDGLYIGESPERPQLGDVRIREYVVPLTTVSVLAKVKGGSFERFIPDEKQKNVNIGKIVSGSVSAGEMLEDLKSDVGWGAWLVRAVGLPIMLFGLLFLFNGAVNFALGRLIINGSSARENWLIRDLFRIGILLALLVAAVPWMRVNPKVGGILLACSAVLFIWPFFRRGGGEPKPGQNNGGDNALPEQPGEPRAEETPSGQASPDAAVSDQPQGGDAAPAENGAISGAGIAAGLAAAAVASTLASAEHDDSNGSGGVADAAGEPEADQSTGKTDSGEPQVDQPAADAVSPDEATAPSADELPEPEAGGTASASGEEAEEKPAGPDGLLS